MDPKLGSARVDFRQCWKGLSFIKEGMEGCECAPLAETEWIVITLGCRVGWQRRESSQISSLAPKFDLLGWRREAVLLVGDMAEAILLPVSSILAQYLDCQSAATVCLLYAQKGVDVIFLVLPRKDLCEGEPLREVA